MNDDLIRTVAQQIAALDNKAAWARIEPALAEAGVPRRQWVVFRDAIWRDRKRRKSAKK